MNCCICGESILDDDYVVRLTAFKFRGDSPNYRLLRTRFQDGSADRFAHINCPVIAGAPMSLIGADEIPMEEVMEDGDLDG